MSHRAATGPLLDAFYARAKDTVAQLSATSALAEAFRDTIKRRDALCRFVTDGRLEADNNIAENAMRGIALGRKNYLFAGSDKGGERAACIYTLVQSANLNGLNPEAYLCDILTKIADGHTINGIDELLPWRTASDARGATASHQPAGPALRDAQRRPLVDASLCGRRWFIKFADADTELPREAFLHTVVLVGRQPAQLVDLGLDSLLRHCHGRAGSFGFLWLDGRCGGSQHHARHVDPMAWLTDVLERLDSGRTKSHELQTLPPRNGTNPCAETATVLAA